MSPSKPLQESDLIFPSAHSDIHTALARLRRSNLTFPNRIRSIVKDSAFIERVAAHFHLPLVANERCGSWYIRPEAKSGSGYFKSTDGHFGQWSFSLRRLNLHLLDLIGRDGGCIIVDSTRRGKSMPDALSKTVPIWIAVINRLLFPDNKEAAQLRTPREVVSASEHAQINARLPDFILHVKRLTLDIESLTGKLNKPLRPVWITPDTILDSTDQPSSDDSFYPVVLCTASSRASNRREEDPNYVQGAADDHESWGHGLDAVTFWRNVDTLLTTEDVDLIEVIADLMATSRACTLLRDSTPIHPANNVLITDNDSAEATIGDVDIVVFCSIAANAALEERLKANGKHFIHLACGTGKLGSRQLRTELSKLTQLDALFDATKRILITCSTGRDLAVGAALAILCRYYRTDGTRHESLQHGIQDAPNKVEIKQRLGWIMVSMPDASPSRATLQSVNAFLMS